MGSEFRVYNHTDRVLIVETEDGVRHRLLAQAVSPALKALAHLWAEGDAPLGKSRVWKLSPGFDVHVSELGDDSSLGDDAGVEADAEPPRLRIFGLGIEPVNGEPAREPAPVDAWFCREDEVWVTVLGAGITGLSVAHELVTRGFRVQVIERAHGSPAGQQADGDGTARFLRGLTEPDIGGIARTQWATRPLESAGIGVPLAVAPRGDAPESLRSVHGDAIWLGQGAGAGSIDGYHAFRITWSRDADTGQDTLDDSSKELAAWLKEMGTTAGRSLAACQLVVVVYEDPDGAEPAEVERAYHRGSDFLALLRDRRELAELLDRLEVLPTARIDVHEPDPGGRRVGLMVRVHEDLGLIAGEHGFRFFPGFYRHLRDTMRRTPIFDPVTRTFTQRTALDNLEEVDWQVIADPARKQIAPFWRKPFTTLGALIEQYRALRRDTGYRPVDLLRFWLRIVRYMTSSTERREAYYEGLSWWDFLSLAHLDDPQDTTRLAYGARFGEALRHSPKALVAMGAEFADARTQGNLSIQLLMDQFGLHDASDSTLVGPTSTSWLAHWRTYLEQQGVRFFLGEVTAIDVATQDRDRLDIDVVFPGGPPPEYLDGEAAVAKGQIHAHYVVSALDLPALARVTARLRSSADGASLAAIADLVGDANGTARDLEDITTLGQPTLTGDTTGISDRWQTLTGIQFYYKHHVSFTTGHIYFADSPWGLSAISQIQYWGPFGSGHHGRLAGNLSIDIGSWRAAGDTPSPNALARDEIAARVQEQIDRCTVHGAPPKRRAELYHLDDFIAFTVEGGRMRPSRNHAPFLINVVGDWETRPRGKPWSPNTPAGCVHTPGDGAYGRHGAWWPSSGGYPVHHKNLVIAGTHLRTFTRMGTMETANESARHAVNTLLDHATRFHPPPRPHGGPTLTESYQPTPEQNVDKTTTLYGDYCDIWDPEDNEFQDLDFLRLVDKHLMEAARRPQDDAPPDRVRRRVPHLFDILRIDELAELIDDDGDAIGVLEMIGGAMKALDDARIDDLPNLQAVIAKLHEQIAAWRGRYRR